MIFVAIPWSRLSFWSNIIDVVQEDVKEWLDHYGLLIIGGEPRPGCVQKLDFSDNEYSMCPGIAFHPDDARLAILAKLKWGGEL